MNKEKGFQLSPQAFKTLGLELQNIDKSKISISKSALVTFKNENGVYVLRDGFFKMLKVSLVLENEDSFEVELFGFKPKDKLVTKGVKLLRVTDIYSTDKSEYGHSH